MTGPAATALADWQGEMGDEYTARNGYSGDVEEIEQRARFLDGALSVMPPGGPRSVLEVGANVGKNLIALAKLYPRAALYAAEPNDAARAVLGRIDLCTGVRADPVQELGYDAGMFELVLSCGLLIHLPPDQLGRAMDQIHRVAKLSILVAEYFAPQERELSYRGQGGRLWLRDYGSLFLDRFSDLRLVDYGFAWKRTTGLDNLTWWLLEKRA